MDGFSSRGVAGLGRLGHSGTALSTARNRAQSGFSLIEVLAALAIASFVILGLASGLLTMLHADAATAERQKVEMWLGNYSESIKAAPYLPCHVSADAASVAAYTGAYGAWASRWNPPADVRVRISKVEYWDKASAKFIDTCGAMDQGTQRLSLEVQWKGLSATSQVVKAPRL